MIHGFSWCGGEAPGGVCFLCGREVFPDPAAAELPEEQLDAVRAELLRLRGFVSGVGTRFGVLRTFDSLVRAAAAANGKRTPLLAWEAARAVLAGHQQGGARRIAEEGGVAGHVARKALAGASGALQL